MTTGMTHQKDAVGSGFWPLYRYDPRQATEDGTPFRLDSRKPKIPFKEFAMQQARFAMLGWLALRGGPFSWSARPDRRRAGRPDQQ